MPRNHSFQLYLETSNQIHRPNQKNQQCGLSNPQSHMHKVRVDWGVCTLAMNTLTGTLGGNICMNMVVYMGKLLWPPAAQPRYQGGTWYLCSLHRPSPTDLGWWQLCLVGVTAGSSSGSPVYSVTALQCFSVQKWWIWFRITFCTLLRWIFRHHLLCISKVCNWYCALKTKTSVPVGLAFLVFLTENVS